MLQTPKISAGFSRARYLAQKLVSGIEVVGLAATIAGGWRVLMLRWSRPSRSEIRLRSGCVLEYEYPSQFAPHLVMFGDLVDPEFAFLRNIARPGWRIVDVGAAIGQFSTFAADFPRALVEAFEPSSANIATLVRNAARNSVGERVRVHQVALSNSPGEARFATAQLTWMSSLTAPDCFDGEMVRVATLSRELERLRIDHVDVLKINVAGFEPAVLEGALESFADQRVDVLITLLGLESLPWYGAIAQLGYRFFYYHPKKRRLYEITSFDQASVLLRRPWPARHIIAVRNGAIASGLISGIPIQSL